MRQIVLVTLAGIGGALALSWVLHERRVSDACAIAGEHQAVVASHLAGIVKRDVGNVLHDLQLLDGLESMRQADSEAALRLARRDFETFARARPDYFQVRYIDASGDERIRFDRDGEVVAHATSLQNKADRYYFVDAMKRAPGHVYVSPLDWNVEFGRVETPMRPTVRFAIRSAGGIVILNADARVLLRAVREASAGFGGEISIREVASARRLVTASAGQSTFLPEPGAISAMPQILREAEVSVGDRSWVISVSTAAAKIAEQARTGFLEHLALTALVVVLMLASGGLAMRFARRSAQLDAAERHARELHVANAELHRTRAMLVERTQLATVGEMVPTLAHELRNPLQAMLTAAKTLRDDVREDDARRLLSILTEEIARLDRIVSAILTRDAHAAPAGCDLAVLTRHVVELIEAGRGERAIPVIDVRLPASLPVQAPADTLKQVIWNVLRNACEAAGPSGHVWVGARQEAERAILEVDDDGPGPGGKPEGEGLGLALCEQLVRENGGSLDLSASPRGGARLTIRIPASRPAEVPA